MRSFLNVEKEILVGFEVHARDYEVLYSLERNDRLAR
jgi:hypothetical protein